MNERMDELLMEEQTVAAMPEGFETQCWGCGLRLLLTSYSPEFKCGWCGALTIKIPIKHNKQSSYFWRRLLDRFLVTTLIMFMLFVIGMQQNSSCKQFIAPALPNTIVVLAGGGVWAVYPVVFSVNFLCGAFHSVITFFLSVATLSSYFLAALRMAGPPPSILWGSYPVVGKDSFENYTFCIYCAKPKSPRTHHCRSCGTCVLDMDHHCPFIGNCVGAANHRAFIAFLISAIVSTMYASVMCIFAGFRLWPSLAYGSIDPLFVYSRSGILRVLKDITRSLLNSAFLLSTRGIILMYLFVASLSIQIGLIVLLAQQLKFIYEGQTYISYISSSGNGNRERGLHNLCQFFACPYTVSRFVPGSSDARKKSHRK